MMPAGAKARHRLVLLAATMAAVVATPGCGDDGGTPAPTPPTAANGPAKSGPYDVPAAPASKLEPKGRQRKPRKKAAARRRERLVRSVATTQLALLRLENGAVRVGDGGRAVTITLLEEAACDARAGDRRRIASALAEALAFIETVHVGIYGHEGSLTRYQRESCPHPARFGPLFMADGKGPETAGPFTIRTRRWRLEYTAGAKPFRLRVLRDGQLVRQIGPPLGGSDSRTIGGLGLYTISVTTPGNWSLRVRELQ